MDAIDLMHLCIRQILISLNLVSEKVMNSLFEINTFENLTYSILGYQYLNTEKHWFHSPGQSHFSKMRLQKINELDGDGLEETPGHLIHLFIFSSPPLYVHSNFPARYASSLCLAKAKEKKMVCITPAKHFFFTIYAPRNIFSHLL